MYELSDLAQALLTKSSAITTTDSGSINIDFSAMQAEEQRIINAGNDPLTLSTMQSELSETISQARSVAQIMQTNSDKVHASSSASAGPPTSVGRRGEGFARWARKISCATCRNWRLGGSRSTVSAPHYVHVRRGCMAYCGSDAYLIWHERTQQDECVDRRRYPDESARRLGSREVLHDFKFVRAGLRLHASQDLAQHSAETGNGRQAASNTTSVLQALELDLAVLEENARLLADSLGISLPSQR